MSGTGRDTGVYRPPRVVPLPSGTHEGHEAGQGHAREGQPRDRKGGQPTKGPQGQGEGHRLPDTGRELCVIGSDWRRVLAVDVGTVSELFSLADRDRLAVLVANTDGSASFDVLVGPDRTALWLGDERLAVIPTKNR